MNSAVIKMTGVTVAPSGRETPVLAAMDLQFFRGDFVVVLGANGSGKSTLLKVLDGRCRPTVGKVAFAGGNGAVATLTQAVEEATFSSLTVYENCLLSGMDRGKSRDALAAYLNRYHPALGAKLDDLCTTLSGGQRQALALALCVANKPDVLLLDEHTSALDPVTQRNLMEMTAHEAANHVAVTVMITHDLTDALRYGNRLLVLSHGRIIGDYSADKKRGMSVDDLFKLLSERADKRQELHHDDCHCQAV